MVINEQNNFFEITFPWSARLLNAVKLLPGRYWHSDTKTWRVPINQRPEVEAFAIKYGFSFGEVQDVQHHFTIPELPDLNVNISLKRKLFPYQEKGVAYCLDKKRLIIGDQPGLGKTGQSIAAITAANAFPCLVICPSSLKINWQREWEIWTNKRARVIDEPLARYMHRWVDSGMIDVFIVNYESLKKYFVVEMNKPESGRLTLKNIKFSVKKDLFKSVIIDESHRCKDFKTLQTKFTKGIAEGKEYIFALTGTPVVNKPKDLLPQLGIIDRIDDMGGYRFFMQRYCGGMNGSSNLKELNFKLSTKCFYRRDKSEVLKDLPAKIRQIVYCEIDDKHRLEYNKAQEDLREYLIKYREATDERVESAMRGEVMVRIGILKNISARGKLNDVCDYIQEVLESGEKLVVFLHLKEVFAKLKSMFPKAVSIVGEDNQLQRQHAVDSFQNNPECKLILCSMQAAGVGLTLTASSRVAFVEQGWTAAAHDQCEDRCHRIGQKDSVQCLYFIGKDTIDEWVYKIINEKRSIANDVTGAKDEVQVDVVDRFATLFNIQKKKVQNAEQNS